MSNRIRSPSDRRKVKEVRAGGRMLQPRTPLQFRRDMTNFLQVICSDDEGQDIAEYAVMLAVILVIVVGTIWLVGTNAISPWRVRFKEFCGVVSRIFREVCVTDEQASGRTQRPWPRRP